MFTVTCHIEQVLFQRYRGTSECQQTENEEGEKEDGEKSRRDPTETAGTEFDQKEIRENDNFVGYF